MKHRSEYKVSASASRFLVRLLDLQMTSFLSGLGVVVLCAVVARLSLKKRQKSPLPPGPPADPLIGHLRIFPEPQTTAETFYDWSLQYGE